MKRIILNKSDVTFRVEEVTNSIKDNTIIDEASEITIYCEKDEFIERYKYKLLNKLLRRLSKQVALIKEAKKVINNDIN